MRDNDSAAQRMTSRNGKSRVAVPSHFYKILTHRINDQNVEVLAVLMPNDKTNLDGEEAIRYIEDHLVPLNELERQTGLTLFPAIGAISASQATSLWPYGKTAARSLAHNCAP